MVHKIFCHTSTVFLPIIDNPVLAKHYVTRAREHHRVLTEETTHIVAHSWKDVLENFEDHRGLLNYFRFHCYVVSEDWVFYSVESNERQKEYKYTLD